MRWHTRRNQISSSAKRTSPSKSAGTSVQSTTGKRVGRINGSNAGYNMFRGSVKGTGYPLHSPVSPSIPLPCVTVCRHISIGVQRPHVSQKHRIPKYVNFRLEFCISEFVKLSVPRLVLHLHRAYGAS